MVIFLFLSKPNIYIFLFLCARPVCRIRIRILYTYTLILVRIPRTRTRRLWVFGASYIKRAAARIAQGASSLIRKQNPLSMEMEMRYPDQVQIPEISYIYLAVIFVVVCGFYPHLAADAAWARLARGTLARARAKIF